MSNTKYIKDLKILMFLQHSSAYTVGHGLALELKKLGIRHFAAYSFPYKSANFLKKQKDIKYDPIIVDEDLVNSINNEKIDFGYLKKMEKEYDNLNFWNYIFNDRYLSLGKPKKTYSYEPNFGYEDCLKILQVRLKAIDNLIDNFKPDLIIFSAIAVMPSYLMHSIAKKKGIKSFMIANTRVNDRISIFDDLENYFAINNVYNKIKSENYQSQYSEEAINFLNFFRNKQGKVYKNAEYDYVNKKFSIIRVIKFIKYFIAHIFEYYTTYLKNDYAEARPMDWLKERFMAKLRVSRGCSDLFEKIDLDNNKDNYVFYPLHLEPEMTTLFLAPYYTNQINLIKNIAQSLPIDYKLYVKEAPNMLYKRKRSYYKKIKRFPNVVLVDINISSFNLIKNSKLVTTITGTAGFEAILLKKPVITFGKVFYNLFSSVKRCREIEKLPQIINYCLENFKYTEENEKEIVSYLSAVFEESVSIDYDMYLQGQYLDFLIQERTLKPLAEYLISKF